MDFVTFVNNAQSDEFLHVNKSICFTGRKEKYPLLFFSLLFKQGIGISVETINTADEDTATIMAKLSTTFLGNTSFYWLKNISALKGKKQKTLFVFFKQYTGPNSIAFFVDQEALSNPKEVPLCISLPEKIDQKLFMQLASYLGMPVIKTHKPLVSTVFKKGGALSLDSACLLMQSLMLIGRGGDELVLDWLANSITPEHSLNELSQYFFAKQARSFFTLWSCMTGDYSPQFWLSFWSDQLWRAFNFVEQSQQKNFIEAKRLRFRLPYRFVQRDFKTANLSALRAAHNFLYLVDCSLKNGGSPFSLELFYSYFLNDQFCKITRT